MKALKSDSPVDKKSPSKDHKHSKTERAAMEEQNLLRALLDLSPDALIVIDPHDPNVSWPIIDCNVASCRMNGFFREELIGHSIDILNVTEGTQEERDAYLKQLREV